MPPMPVPRAAALSVPIRRGYDSSSFPVGKFSLGVDYLFYFFEECWTWGQEDHDARSKGIKGET